MRSASIFRDTRVRVLGCVEKVWYSFWTETLKGGGDCHAIVQILSRIFPTVVTFVSGEIKTTIGNMRHPFFNQSLTRHTLDKIWTK